MIKVKSRIGIEGFLGLDLGLEGVEVEGAFEAIALGVLGRSVYIPVPVPFLPQLLRP